MPNNVHEVEYGPVKESTKRPECSATTGSRAIAGALARMSTVSNQSHEDQGALAFDAWQQWGDWDNGHVDS